MLLKLFIAGFSIYGLWAMNQGKRKHVKWAVIGAVGCLAVILLQNWKEWYLENLGQ